MKSKIAICVLGMISLSVVSLAPAQQPAAGKTEKMISALEAQWTQAIKSNNLSLADPLLADRFVATSQDGKVQDKATLMTDTAKVKWASAELKDETIAVFGNTAIARGELRLKGTAASGEPVNTHTRYTDTWVKMPDGKWQCVALQELSLEK